MTAPDAGGSQPPTSFWALERDEFGRPVVVRHRHADKLVAGYVGKGSDGVEYARCAECGAQEPLAAITEGTTNGGSIR
jgi:hypothetical protein